MTNLERYQDIFMDLFSLEQSDLETPFTFQDQERWDSLAHLQLIGELEDAFAIMLDSEDILTFGSFENGKNILKKYGVEIEQ